jgi:hypothetical protein
MRAQALHSHDVACPAHVSAAPAEAGVAALDRVEEQRPVQFVGDREREPGVALELGQTEAGT